MSTMLTKEAIAKLEPAEVAAFESPVPTQIISNGEFDPIPQTPEQRKVEERIKEIADGTAEKLGLSRRTFLRTSSGMAAAFLAMNEVFGPIFDVSPAEAAQPEVAAARAKKYAKQFVMDVQLHFVRDDYPGEVLLGIANYAAKNWNPSMLTDGAGMTLNRYKFDNFLKEVYLDSDTKIGVLSAAPFDDHNNWFLDNDQMKRAHDIVDSVAGSNRLLYHSMVLPGQPGWLEEVDRCIEVVKPNSWKGYTIGDPLAPQNTHFPWRLDDEKLVYPFYERAVKSGITTICIHKGLLPADYETAIAGGAWRFANVDDLPKAAKDWPQLNFVIYHSALRAFLESPDASLAEFEKTGYIQWTSDLARIPEKYGLTNIYADVGASFANSATTNPRFCAAFMGTLIKGLGHDHVWWGTDSVFFGSPQWQIEAFRRLEIPEDMQKKHGFAPLGPADGKVKSAILGRNAAKFYKIDVKHAMENPLQLDNIARMKEAYLEQPPERTNRAYGYVTRRA